MTTITNLKSYAGILVLKTVCNHSCHISHIYLQFLAMSRITRKPRLKTLVRIVERAFIAYKLRKKQYIRHIAIYTIPTL